MALRQALQASPAFASEFDEIVLVERIPRTELGKIQRAELRKLLVGSRTGIVN